LTNGLIANQLALLFQSDETAAYLLQIIGEPLSSGNSFSRASGGQFAPSIDLNHWLVENGWAINFEPYAKGRFKTGEDAAVDQPVGFEVKGHYTIRAWPYAGTYHFAITNIMPYRQIADKCRKKAREFRG
jgi:hypothetical protein